ncbi:MAG: substrate-binding domain-containing protein, partial [Spirochaetota bacterium]
CAVLVDDYSPEVSCICLDVEHGIRAAVNHLIELGHSKIAHLAINIPKDTFQKRSWAYKDALEEARISYNPVFEKFIDISSTRACTSTRELLNSHNPPSAIVCDDDLLAVGVYKAAKELRVKIPEELSVIGFDDIDICRILDPELTTVSVSSTELGYEACDLLIKGIKEKKVKPIHILKPVGLKIRQSTARIK